MVEFLRKFENCGIKIARVNYILKTKYIKLQQQPNGLEVIRRITDIACIKYFKFKNIIFLYVINITYI